ncbi:unnamed protein product [Chondrus crispus]|uniref:GHMP kinase N-terminal domain-containing protein n=1 Tax=Chondrus crispus TaxID=2769 RepID=R7QAH9_CHOCR|nr:unnamed protein product [Chondrus crispus]CDF35497.1 unnamed protein product [Chondrus crispus]|eukprot:XP_005715316.1 unnamed protein product [Chondrus crispus]
MSTPISLFVPGRLCLAGEHSDWAASYRLQSPSIAPGAALVVGLQQGLRATASRIESDLDVSSSLAGFFSISPCDLFTVSRSKNPWRLSAAVGFIIRQRYGVTGLSLNVTGQTLPAGKGLSSSAAVCVLTARAFNVLYRLHLTTSGEMEVAYAAERLTGSPCGRMDQVVAAGPGRIARMKFDGDFVEHRVLEVPDGRPIYIVLADLGMQKDTKAILTGLHRAYPDGDSLDCKTLQDALGATNLELIAEMEEAITQSKLERLGQLFMYAQKVFDDAGIPFCPDELRSPALHKILKDRDLQRYSYGGKGACSWQPRRRFGAVCRERSRKRHNVNATAARKTED